jgi:hypothetical protein
VIAVLAGDDLGQEPRPGQAFVDRLRWFGGGRVMALTVPAGVGGSDVLDDEQGWKMGILVPSCAKKRCRA